jgi:TonB family protein
MRKTATLFFVLLFLLLAADQPSNAQSRNRDLSVFAPEGEGFTIRNKASLSLSDPDPSSQSREYWGNFGNVRVSIVSDTIGEKSGFYERAVDFATSSKAKGFSTVFRGLKAQKFVFEDTEGFSREIIAVRTKKRKYVFQTISGRKSEPDSRRFFSSIRINTSRLNPPVPAALPRADSPNSVYYLPDPSLRPTSSGTGTSQGSGNGVGQGSGRGTGVGSGAGRGSGSGQGSGTGTGNGSGSGSGDGQGPGSGAAPRAGDPLGITIGVRIISKPRANYTDAARSNNIQGTVMLRVTFLASGTIGGISPVSGLPYGLTEQAIAAARLMRFEPAKKNGVPYTVTKVVPYYFTIY